MVLLRSWMRLMPEVSFWSNLSIHSLLWWLFDGVIQYLSGKVIEWIKARMVGNS
jgi:hypothetical protein